MQTEYKIVIADTTCFILFDNIGELKILKALFGTVITTSVIAREFGTELPAWVEIRDVKDLQFQSTLDIDAGEASAIALAVESTEPSLLIIDDNKGRKVARRLNLNVTGSLGVFLKAKRAGIIPAIKPIIEKIQKTNFRQSEAILQEILFLAGE
jgi:predicted nucleic acid-binding protein